MKKKKKNKVMAAMGRKGGLARAKNMSPQERIDSATKAITARWSKVKNPLIDL